MKNSMKNITTGLFALMFMIFVGLGCSQSEEKPANNSNTTANSSSNDNKSNANSTAATTKNNADIAGSYGITGKNPEGQTYNGDMTIKKQDSVYQFSWNVGGSAYDGVGIRSGDLIAVGYGAGDTGKGCGAAIYKIGDKMLEGKLGGWGHNQAGTQTAVLLKQTKDGDVYTVSGTDTDGSDYKGEMFVTLSKTDVYHFAFAGGKIKYVGSGIKVGDYFGAGLGVKKCGYVVYDLSKGDRLEAAWGVIGDERLGTEIATRK